jgi:hypothetical protein
MSSSRCAEINIVSVDADILFDNVMTADVHRVGSLRELGELLEHRPASGEDKVLNLIGHSTKGSRFLRIGSEPINMLTRPTAHFFEGLAAVVERLRVTRVRLLGCETATTEAGRKTLRALSRVLGVPTYGSMRSIMRSHYDEHGFNPAFEHLLIESSDL